MLNNYSQKHKERFRKEPRERYQNLSEKEKQGRRNQARKSIKTFLRKKKKRHINITWNVKRSYLTIEEVII